MNVKEVCGGLIIWICGVANFHPPVLYQHLTEKKEMQNN